MNNLLRTLTESQVKSNASNSDLKLLLTTVKEARRQGHDSKLADPFYDSLEGLLLDLRTVSIDNHDAEAFLKPVLKAEAPDYYDVIHTPMDFQTMLKKVKQKQYKSKKEFKDDLDLIWSNCLTYNATPSHPLRKCALRLKKKADKLLQNITDRKERTDPHIPSELSSTTSSAPTKLNGHINGVGHARTYTPSATSSSKASTPPNKSATPLRATATYSSTKPARKDLPFAETPALIRTGEGMAFFRELDSGLEEAWYQDEPSKVELPERLRELAASGYDFSVPALSLSSSTGKERTPSVDKSPVVGDKRKLNGTIEGSRPLKRARVDSFSSSSTLVQPQPSSQSSTTAYGQSPYTSTPSSVASTTLVAGSTAPTSPATVISTPSPYALSLIESDPTSLWWSATHSDSLLANGLPEIPCRSSSPLSFQRKRRRNTSPAPIPLFPGTLPSSSSTSTLPPAPSIPTPGSKRKKRRKRDILVDDDILGEGDAKETDGGEQSNPKSLLALMNSNIRTMKRIRMTHTKFAALGLGKDGNPVGGEDADAAGAGDTGGMMDVDDAGVVAGGVGLDESDKVDDRPWMVKMRETAVHEEDVSENGGSGKKGESSVSVIKTAEPGVGVGGVAGVNFIPPGPTAGNDAAGDASATMHAQRKPKPGKRRRVKPGHVVGGIEMGSQNANACLSWVSGKVLEHVGFQGSSKVALDVMAGVTADYLLNVGRTIKFLSDKFANTMTVEEIVLHTLFESGMSKVQDLDRYVTDDVERYGSRLGDLEKKLVGAYREATAADGDPDLEDSEDELAFGGFADSLGMDYFGLKELGIADELGMSNLTVPRRLLKGKKKQNALNNPAKPNEPPLPYPLPPPLVPLTAAQVPDQIGLLQPYYNQRLTALMPPMVSTQPQPPISAYPSIPLLPGPSLTPNYPHLYMQPPPPPGPSSAQSPAQSQSTTSPQPSQATNPPTPNPQVTSALSAPSLPSASQQPPASAHPYPHPYPAFGAYMAVAIPAPHTPQQPPQPPPTLALPDDPPPPAQVKMGPLGQILKTGASSNPAAKKKAAKAQAAAAKPGPEVKVEPATEQNPASAVEVPPGSAGSIMSNPLTTTPMLGANGSGAPPGPTPSPVGAPEKKKKGPTGVGSGNGRKNKKALEAQSPHKGQGNQGNQGSGQPPPSYPPVVTASA
ncbi:Transcriptional activator spt7 [Marasmius crinis-equi]|uniref:Transcriptional activator spt7 n=1 Tax=Marasmius crinis-equi TaxID=585013 RepID=A0ABR3FET4_9AGAR